MKKQLSSFLFIVAVFLCRSTTAQVVTLSDINGQPFFETTYTHVEGSPYLSNAWISGVVKMANGVTYSDLKLKYDMVEGIPLFMNSDGSPLKFVDKVAEFKLEPSMVFRSGYQEVDNNTQQTFYQVLYDGEVSLIKEQGKLISESRAYNSASVNKKFLNFESYYLVRDNQPVQVKKNKNAILLALKTKKAELEGFIDKNKLDLKQEPDLVMLVEYYNSI